MRWSNVITSVSISKNTTIQSIAPLDIYEELCRIQVYVNADESLREIYEELVRRFSNDNDD